MEMPKPTEEHKWLQQLLGEWTFEACVTADPNGEKGEGREVGRPIGDVWVQLEGRVPMADGTEMTSVMTLGYDPQKGKFVGSWIGSMMTHHWVYEGSLDPTGKILTLDCEGPSFTKEGEIAPYRDIIEIKGPDERVLTGNTLNEKGEWTQFMETTYRRVA